jgi:hypothetical protein
MELNSRDRAIGSYSARTHCAGMVTFDAVYPSIAIEMGM